MIPPVTFAYRRYSKWARKVNRAIWSAYGDCNAVATESIGNIRTVRAFASEPYELDRYNQGINVALEHGKTNAYVSATVTAFSSYMNLFTSILILWYGGLMVIRGEGGLTIGTLITFQLYWNMMNTAFLSLANVFNELIRASSAAERVFQIMDVKPSMPLDAGDRKFRKKQPHGELRVEGLEFFYQTRPANKVLKGVDLVLKPGTVTALVGKSGGGKSTIIHLLLRFYDPTGGCIRLDGTPLTELNALDIRKHVGLVAQDTQLFATTILENLLYGFDGDEREKVTKKQVLDACKMANAHEFIMDTEEQYETRIGEKGVMLSGGQKQRLALARCFLRRPKLLFLDEATSALDAENEALVQEGIDRLLTTIEGGCTVLLIAHRLSTVMNANQIAVMSGGTVVELGTHDRLCSTEHLAEGGRGIYARLVARQMKKEANVIKENEVEGDQGGQRLSRAGSTKSDGGVGVTKAVSKGKDGKPAPAKTEIDELFDEEEEDGK